MIKANRFIVAWALLNSSSLHTVRSAKYILRPSHVIIIKHYFNTVDSASNEMLCLGPNISGHSVLLYKLYWKTRRQLGGRGNHRLCEHGHDTDCSVRHVDIVRII